EPSASLEVRVVDPDPSRTSSCFLVVSCPTQPFLEGSTFGGPPMQHLLGATQAVGEEEADGETSSTFSIGADGRLLLAGFRPGVSFQLEVRDSASRVLAVRSLALALGEWAQLEIPLAR